MQLVDKRKLISDVESISAEYGDDNSSLIEQGDVLDLIEEAPTVDAIPVVRGRWIMRGGKRYCSVCGERACVTRDTDDFWYTVGTKYCPHCGAEMTGVVQEGNGKHGKVESV